MAIHTTSESTRRGANSSPAIGIGLALLFFAFAAESLLFAAQSRTLIDEGVFLAAALFVGAFFRNPDRLIPGDENTVVAPADGRVIEVTAVGATFVEHEGEAVAASTGRANLRVPLTAPR